MLRSVQHESIRICNPKYDDIYQFHPDGRVTGAIAPFFEVLLDTVRGLNVSFDQTSSSGVQVDPVNRIYDGCIGSIQKNESDIMFFGFLTYPVMGPNLTNKIVCASEKLGVMSGYNSNTPHKPTLT